jgi:hypothetical protein
MRSSFARFYDPVVAGAISFVAYAVIVVLLWRGGLFDFSATTDNAQQVAAVLGVVAGFLGLLLKHSVDIRTSKQFEASEERLRLETSLRAVELLTDHERVASPPERQAGALFVLASKPLDQVEFALALLGELWPKNEISPSAAVWVVNKALMSGDRRMQEDAAGALARNAASLTEEGASIENGSPICWRWPACVTWDWSTEIALPARELILEALIKVMKSKDREAWKERCAMAFLGQFEYIRKVDDERVVRDTAVRCMALLFDAALVGIDRDSERVYRGHAMTVPDSKTVGELRDEVSRLAPKIAESDLHPYRARLIKDLRAKWVDNVGVVEAPAEPQL